MIGVFPPDGAGVARHQGGGADAHQHEEHGDEPLDVGTQPDGGGGGHADSSCQPNVEDADKGIEQLLTEDGQGQDEDGPADGPPVGDGGEGDGGGLFSVLVDGGG